MMKVLHARPGKNEGDKPFWTQVGVAFPSRGGDGSVNVILNYLPLTPDKDGAVRLLLKEDEGERKPRQGRNEAEPGHNLDPHPDDQIPF